MVHSTSTMITMLVDAMEMSVITFVLHKSVDLSCPVEMFYHFFFLPVMQSHLFLSKMKRIEAVVVHCKEKVNLLMDIFFMKRSETIYSCCFRAF